MKNNNSEPPNEDYKAKVCATPVGPCAEVESRSPITTFLIAGGVGVVFMAAAKVLPKLLRGVK